MIQCYVQKSKVVWAYPYVTLIEPGNCLCNWIEKFGNLLAGWKTLFLIDDIITNETLDKQRKPLLGLGISVRHKSQMLWMLMQSYTAIPVNIRRQVKMLYICYPKSQGD